MHLSESFTIEVDLFVKKEWGKGFVSCQDFDTNHSRYLSITQGVLILIRIHIIISVEQSHYKQ